jgi:hypothetical protein
MKLVPVFFLCVTLCVRGAVTFEKVAFLGDPAPDAPAGTVLSLGPSSALFDGDAIADPNSVFFHAGLSKNGIDGPHGYWAGAPGSVANFVRTGDLAPGGKDGEKFSFLDGLVAANHGGIWSAAFNAHVAKDETGDTGEGIWAGPANALRLVVRVGRPAPGLKGVSFATARVASRLSDDGSFVFYSLLRGAGVAFRNRVSLWLASPNGKLKLLARQGSLAPGGLRYSGAISALINPAGDVVIWDDNHAGEPHQANAIWLHSAEKTVLVAKTGQPAPGLAAGVNFGPIEAFGFNAAGDIAFWSGLQGAGFDENNNGAIFVGQPDDLHPRGHGGEAAPLPHGTGTFVTFVRPNYFIPDFGQMVLRDDGTVVAMAVAQAADSSEGTVGLWSLGAQGKSLIAAVGEPAPGSARVFDFTFGALRVNHAGRLMFSASISPDGDYGLWAQDGNGLVVKIAESGDTIDVGGETVTVKALAPAAWSDGDSLLFLASLTDNRFGLFLAHVPPTAGPGVVGFRSRAFTVDEFASDAEVSVERAFGSTGEVVVHYEASAGTATAGDDFTVVSGDLTFADGELRKSFTVPIVNDTTREDMETIALTLTPVSGAATLGQSTATVQIRDNDAPGTLRWEDRPLGLVAENAGSVALKILREGGSGGEVRVHYTTNEPGPYTSAEPNYDFTPASGELVFGPGVTEQTVIVPILDDGDIEVDTKSFEVELGIPTGGATLKDDYQSTVVFLDSDDLFQPAAATYSGGVFEYDNGVGDTVSGTLLLTATRTGSFTATIAFSQSLGVPGRGVAQRYVVRGKFATNGHFEVLLKNGALLTLQMVNGDTLAWALNGAASTARRVLFDAKANPLTLPARLNLVLPLDAQTAQDVDNNIVGGSGWATLTTKPDGNARLAGVLADGTPFSAAQRLNKADTLDFFAVLPRGGNVGGSFTFNGTALTGHLNWIASSHGNDERFVGFYRAGLDVEGVPYAAPVRGSFVLPGLAATEGQARIEYFFDPSDPLHLGVIFAPLPATRAGFNTPDYRRWASFAPATGIFHSTLKPAGEPLTKFSGVALPSLGKVEGFGLTEDASLRWRLHPQ